MRIEYETFSNPIRQAKMERINELEHLILNIKKRLKSDEIDNLTYQRQIRPIRKELKRIGRDIEIDSDKIFEDCFGEFKKTPLGLVRQISVVEYLTYLSHI